MKDKKTYLSALAAIISTVVLYFAKNMIAAMNNSPLDLNSPMVFYVGIVFAVLGIIFVFVERKGNFPFFYGKSQRSGSNANSSVLLGIGFALIAKTWMLAIILSVVGAIIEVAIRSLLGGKEK